MDKLANPYVGPRTFEKTERDRFFGRERETRELLALTVSEQLVLFYAQSGAGKSSLVNTCLIPDLERKGFLVLPVGRVGGDAPSELNIDNVYIFNLLRKLALSEVSSAALAGMSLCDFLSERKYEIPGEDSDKPNKIVLVIDQFEELFSMHPEQWMKREDFFRQLTQAMQEIPYLWVVLVMREDYIASLEPYEHLLPGRLRMRYYMQRLGREAALKAIKRPTEKSRPYAKDVAEKLTADLSGIKVQKPDGTTNTQPGQFIEPVQLQVVCYNLWESLASEGTQITEDDLQKMGDVSQALEQHYAKRIRGVAEQRGVSERSIREWIETKLISSSGTRNMVLQETRKREGDLDNDVIQALQSDLVRSEKRGGSSFYELTHDRLVEPILANNKKWTEENASPLQRQASLWNEQGQNDNWLLSDQALLEVEEWTKDPKNELTKLEKDFLKACRLKQQERDNASRARSVRRQRYVLVGLTIAFVLSLALSFIAIESKRQADDARALALARQLSAQSTVNSQLDLAFLLSLEANQISNAPDIQTGLFKVFQRSSQPFIFLQGHDDYVREVTFSPNGELIASVGDDNKVIIWGSEAGHILNQKSSDCPCDVVTVAFSPDSQMVAAGTPGDVYLLSNLQMSKLHVDKLDVHVWLSSVAFSPNGKILAAAGCGEWDEDDNCFQGQITLWDTQTLQQIGQSLTGHDDWINSISFSSDGNLLASGSDDETIIFWDFSEPQSPSQLGLVSLYEPEEGAYAGVESVVFSPDGKTLASGSSNSDITLWDTTTFKPVRTFSGHTDSVRSVVFSPDGKILASGSSDHTIRLWDVATGGLIEQPLLGHTRTVSSVSFSPDGKRLASASYDEQVIVWNITRRTQITQYLNEPSGSIWGGLGFEPGDNGETFAVSGINSISIWKQGIPPTIIESLSGHTEHVNRLAFSSDGKQLATSSCTRFNSDGNCAEGELFLWDMTASKPTIKSKLSDHKDWITRVLFSPDSKYLATASYDGTVNLLEASTGKEISKPLASYSEIVNDLAFRPDGAILAIAPYDDSGKIELWNMETNPPQLLQTLAGGRESAVYSLAFSPDGKLLAAGSADGVIILWNVEDLTDTKIRQPLFGHQGTVFSIVFSPDGKTLASGSADKTVIWWDVGTGGILGTLSGHTSSVARVDFSPDGKTLAAGGNDGIIILWNIGFESWKSQACNIAGRNLTETEWELYFPGESYHVTCPQWPPNGEVSPVSNAVTATPIAASLASSNVITPVPTADSSLIFNDDFSDPDNTDWDDLSPSYLRNGKLYVVTEDERYFNTIKPSIDFSQYGPDLIAKAYVKSSPNGSIGIYTRKQDSGAFYLFQTDFKDSTAEIWYYDGDEWTKLATQSVTPSTFYNLVIVCEGESLEFHVNGKTISVDDDKLTEAGQVGLYTQASVSGNAVEVQSFYVGYP